ncbi:MAG TPA: hypothetical protein VMZ06_16270 [Candidatus Bathyarchaeia archaeon]|nr:hypothetical protein [Candidatus Bathyarchaeia archaeon]
MNKMRQYRKRGPTFARQLLPAAVEAGRWLYEKYGKPLPTREKNISVLSSSFPNSALLYASLVHFGIIEKVSGSQVFSPEFLLLLTGNASLAKALFFKEPSFRAVFAGLLDISNGSGRAVLMSDLREQICAQRIPEKNAAEFERVFLESAHYAGILERRQETVCLVLESKERATDSKSPKNSDGVPPEEEPITAAFPAELDHVDQDNWNAAQIVRERLRILEDFLVGREKRLERQERYDLRVLNLLTGKAGKGSDKMGWHIGPIGRDLILGNSEVRQVSTRGNNAANVQGNTIQVTEEMRQKFEEGMDLFYTRAIKAGQHIGEKTEAAATVEWLRENMNRPEEPPEAFAKVRFVRKLGDEVWQRFRNILDSSVGSFAALWLLEMVQLIEKYNL